MAVSLPAGLDSFLACPSCGQFLSSSNAPAGWKCQACTTTYPILETGTLDLRLQKDKPVQLDFTVAVNGIPDSPVPVVPLQLKGKPEVDFSSIKVPFHLTRELMSHFPRAPQKDSRVLDLGCGDTVHQKVCEHSGFQYVGMDYGNPAAPLFGDGHALPFQDESFDFVLSIAVLEHIRYPFLMAKEVQRVLKPGGVYIGTVSFMEPHHLDSFYHHSHLGTLNVLQYGGFQIEQLAPSADWRVLNGYTEMVFRKRPIFPTGPFLWNFKLAHWFWWNVSKMINKKSDERLIRDTTGAFTWVARKPK